MLIVNYTQKGVPYSDLQVLSEVERIANDIARYDEYDKTINSSTENIITAFRLAVVKNEIPLDKIQFNFEGKEIKISEYGCFEYMPKGFIDTCDSIIRNIVKEQFKKRKLK